MDEETTTQAVEQESITSDFSIPETTPEPEPPKVDDVAERLAAIEKREKDLQKGFEEIARRKRDLEQPPPVAAPKSDAPQLDPEAQRILDEYVTPKLAPYEAAISTLLQDTMETEMEAYAKAHDLDPDKLMEVVRDKQLTPRGVSRKDRQEVYELAAAVAKTSAAVDIDSLVNAEVEKRLAALAEQGATVVAPPKTERAEQVGGDTEVSPDDLIGDAKIAWFKSKGWIQ